MFTSHDLIVSAQQMARRATVYPAPGSRSGIALVASKIHGLNQPSGAFEELALYCQSADITAVRFTLRAPHHFVSTVLDLRAMVEAMGERGVERMVLVVEAATHRSAAFAPIAYRSVVGLVHRVAGVAIVLPAGGEQASTLPRSFPPDLLFLLRSTRLHAGKLGFQREFVRPDGLTELFIAPGQASTRAAALQTIITPTYSWAQRTLQNPPRDAQPAEETLPTVATPEADPLVFALVQMAAYMAPASIARPSARGRYQDMSANYREVCVWLAREWQLILDDQAPHDPLRELPQDLAWRVVSQDLSAQALLHLFASLRRRLNRTAQVQWIDAYLRASQMIAETTAMGSATPLMTDRARGA